MVGLLESKKKFEETFTRFDTVHEHDGRTYRQTDTGCTASRGI